MMIFLIEAHLKSAPKPKRPRWQTRLTLTLGGVALVPAFTLLSFAISPLLLAVGASALLGIGAICSVADEV